MVVPVSRTRVVPLWRNARVWALFWQVLLLLALGGVVWWLFANAARALSERGMTSGIDFLLDPTTYSLGQSFFSFEQGQSYLAAFLVGLGNTAVLSLIGILTATVIGTAVGFARLSPNVLISGLARVYVLGFRNTPQLVQIVFWYTFFTLLPQPRQAFSLFGGVFASNRGLTVPTPQRAEVYLVCLALIAAGGGLALLLGRMSDRARRRSGQPWRRLGLAQLLALLGPAVVFWLAAGAPLAWSVPVRGPFNFRGGATVSPEFLAIFFGLSFYIAAFIAEIVRGGLLSVDAGQIEAAHAIGLSRRDLYAKVVVPQAMRVIVPPLAAQYVSLLKNSSLGVAVGYPDLFSISNTALTYSGRTIEVLCIMALIYLMLSLAIGGASNWVNRLARIPER